MPTPRLDQIDYGAIVKNYPWLVAKNQKCILSPDADGMLCGLLTSHYLDWEIVGYYDNGKNLILKNDLRAEDCIFLDTEIHRPNIKSVGHHIVAYRKENTLLNLDNFRQCLNPNLLRGRTRCENFGLKYPMGTIHLLLCIISKKYKIIYLDESFFVLLQADGTINRILDRYSENFNDWLNYLGVNDPSNILNRILSKNTNLVDLNRDYVEYLQQFVKTGRDKIPISQKGVLTTSSFDSRRSRFSKECEQVIVDYLRFLEHNTGWIFHKDKWCFSNFRVYEFTKRSERPGVRSFNAAVNKNFLSLVIGTSTSMEYTVEGPDKLP